jgi:hypothetical protein
MIRSIQLGYSYTLTLILALPAAAFMVRLFILFHDCVHGSLFRRQGINTFFGYFLGVLVFTPFEDWRFAHLRHHVTYANLDARGFGDIWTMTLTEYENVSKKKRLQYWLYRNPVVMLGLGALFMFLLRNRLPTRWVKRKERMSIVFTNLLIVVVVLVADRFIGWRTFLCSREDVELASDAVSKALDIRKNGERPFNLLKKREGLEQVRVRSHHGVVVRTTFTTLATLLLELAGTRRTKKSKQKQKKLPLVA